MNELIQLCYEMLTENKQRYFVSLSYAQSG